MSVDCFIEDEVKFDSSPKEFDDSNEETDVSNNVLE